MLRRINKNFKGNIMHSEFHSEVLNFIISTACDNEHKQKFIEAEAAQMHKRHT